MNMSAGGGEKSFDCSERHGNVIKNLSTASETPQDVVFGDSSSRDTDEI